MPQLTTGIVGCGLFGESHATALRGIPEVDIASVFDLDQDRAHAFAQRFGIPKVAASLPELLEESLDTVHVVTPESRHRKAVVAALRSGKHVLVEKPFATNLEDCDAMAAAAKQSARILMVGHILRFDLRYGPLREEALSGTFGKVVSVSARRNRARGGFSAYERVHPGICNAIHDIDLTLSVVRSRVVRVRAFERKIYGKQNPDYFLGVIEFESGAVGTVETSWLLPDAAGVSLDDFFQIIGEKATGTVALQPAAVSIWSEQGYIAPDTGYETRLFGVAHGALQAELDYFYRCVRTGRQPEVVTTAEAKNAVRTALALIESAHSKHDVELFDWD